MSDDGGLILPKKIGWGALIAFLSLAIRAGIAEYRLGDLEDRHQEHRIELRDDIKSLRGDLGKLSDEMDQDNAEALRYLRKMDKFICKLCMANLKPDECAVCDD